MADAGERTLFVAPTVGGWVLVVGSGLPEPSDDVDFCYQFLRELSRKLGNVQFYSINRVLSHHSWALLENGEVYRAYSWCSETLWNEGYVTAAERELGMVCYDYGCEVNVFTTRESLAANSEKVNQLAARWSLDPALVPRETWKANGVVGEIRQSRPN